MTKPGRLGVGIIGAGKVGAVLGAALRGAGHAVVGVSAVSEASRERAENLLPGVPVLEIPEIVERAELVLLAVPDDALPALVARSGGNRGLAARPAGGPHLRPLRRRRAGTRPGRPAPSRWRCTRP